MARCPSFAVTLLSCACALGGVSPALAGGYKFDGPDAALLPADQAFTPVSASWRDGEVELGIRIEPGYYLYRHTLTVTQPMPLANVTLPHGDAYHDEFFGDVYIYRDWVSARFDSASAPETVTVRYQGCADAGVCYPPQTTTMPVTKARQR